MKKIILILSLIMIVGVSNAQKRKSSSRGGGHLGINAGLGVSNWGIPIYAGLDYYITPDISIGGEVSYRSYRHKWYDTYYRHSVIGLFANGNFHLGRVLSLPSNFDLYGGANIGFVVVNSPSNYYGSYTSGLGVGVQAGGRLYLTKSFGLNAELCAGNVFSSAKLGITIKL